MFEPQLTLIPEPDGEYSLLAATHAPNACYAAGRVIRRAPAKVVLPALMTAVKLELRYKPRADPGEARVVHHRVFNLPLVHGRLLRAFVTLDDQILGSADVMVDVSGSGPALVTMMAVAPSVLAVRPPLTPALCQAVAVQATPSSGKFTGPSQKLLELGIIDGTEAQNHRLRVSARMKNIGYTIAPAEVTSAPAVDVATCRDSVFSHAHP